jgi:putative ABC transport system permease protein
VCLAPRLTSRWRQAGDALGTLAGGLLIVVWLRALAGLPTPRGDTRADAITIAAAGLALLLAIVWTATRALGPALRLLDRALAPFGRLRAVVRPAGGYLGWQRSRTGMAVVMFGMVVFIMVAALTLIHVLLNAYDRNEAPVAGFEIRATTQPATPIPDMQTALTTASASSPAAFSAVGGVAMRDVQVVQLGAQRSGWRSAALAAADDGFLDAARVSLIRRAPGYESDAAVWQALRDEPGTAVISAALVGAGGAVQLPPGPFASTTVWARPDEDNPSGVPVKLTIIGVVAPSSDLAAALYASRASVAPLGALPDASTWYFQLATGVAVPDAVTGLQVSFAAQGLVVSDLGDTLRVSNSVRTLLTRLVQGFMGLGLIAGIAALGLLGVQSVIERRRQLGTLRALGFTRWETRATLAIESAITAALGVSIGIALGLLLARSLAALLAADHPEIIFAVPWGQIALTAGIAWLGSALAITLAAWQAGRVSPADALRVA